MDQEDTVRKFLLDTYGYGKIYEFLHSGKKKKGLSLRNFLDGTIIGTFRSKAIEGIDSITVTWPGISKVKATSDKGAEYKRKDLSHHIFSIIYFENKKMYDVGNFLIEKVMSLFPETRLELNTGKTKNSFWTYSINNPYFGLCVEGSSKQHCKLLYTDFNASQELVEHLGEIVKEYYQVMNAVRSRRSSPPPSKK